MSGLTPEGLAEAITNAVHAAMDARTRIQEDLHREHHTWVADQIARSQVRQEFWRAIAAKSFPAMIWSLIAAGFTGAVHLIRNHINWQ